MISAIEPSERLTLLSEILDRERARNEVEADIDQRVRASLEEKRREHFLREQLRVIQDTLGENSGPKNEAEQYASLIEGLPLDMVCLGGTGLNLTFVLPEDRADDAVRRLHARFLEAVRC